MIGRHCSGIRTGGTDDSDALCHRESKILNAFYFSSTCELRVLIYYSNNTPTYCTYSRGSCTNTHLHHGEAADPFVRRGVSAAGSSGEHSVGGRCDRAVRQEKKEWVAPEQRRSVFGRPAARHMRRDDGSHHRGD